jgi:rRNA maturation protein Rpf1
VILITTSRRPTRRLLSFVKELAYSLPNTLKIQRGKLGINGLTKMAMESGISKIIIVHRWKGNPGKIELRKIEDSKLKIVPPLIYLAGIKLRREYGIKEKFKIDSVSFEKNSSPKIKAIAKVFSEFIEIPLINEKFKEKFKASLHISQHSKYEAKVAVTSLPNMKEIGPTFIVKHTIWENLELNEH